MLAGNPITRRVVDLYFARPCTSMPSSAARLAQHLRVADDNETGRLFASAAMRQAELGTDARRVRRQSMTIGLGRGAHILIST